MLLGAIVQPGYADLAWERLPKIIDMNEAIGPLTESVALDAGLPAGVRPVVYPTLDDQAAGLIGGGAVDAGQVAVILGNSAVVNSSSADLPRSGTLDAMKLENEIASPRDGTIKSVAVKEGAKVDKGQTLIVVA